MTYSTLYMDTKCDKKKNLSILIVDDDAIAGNFFKSLLELRGHNVTILREGISCINICLNKHKHYDVIFMDYHIDDINGIEVTRAIKEFCKNKSIIFAYTGDRDAVEKFKVAGMDGVLIKPVDINPFYSLMNILEKTGKIDKKITKKVLKQYRNNILIFD